MPYLGELEEVIGLFANGMSVLELGCGTGRLCARLADAGCRVTGVDESAAMLACLPPAVDPVQSSIEDLSLGKVYDAVLLASHLINHPDPAARQAFIRCARRHLYRGGLFILERHDPEWLDSVRIGPAGRVQGISVHVDGVAREDQLVHMTLRYELSNQVWRHSFTAVALPEGEIEALLRNAGFGRIRWHGERRLWASAHAVDAGTTAAAPAI